MVVVIDLWIYWIRKWYEYNSRQNVAGWLSSFQPPLKISSYYSIYLCGDPVPNSQIEIHQYCQHGGLQVGWPVACAKFEVTQPWIKALCLLIHYVISERFDPSLSEFEFCICKLSTNLQSTVGVLDNLFCFIVQGCILKCPGCLLMQA